MQRRTIKALLLSFSIIFLFGSVSCSKIKKEEEVKLRILTITDLHANLMNYDYYIDSKVDDLGLVKIATLIKEAEEENPNTVIVDNGDTIQGTPLSDYYSKVNPIKPGEGNPVYNTEGKIGFDAIALGNHEFNYGLESLNQAIKDSKVPIVCANVYKLDETTNYFTPYTILNKKVKDTANNETNIKVGIIGVVPPQVLNWDKTHLEGKVVVKDMKKTLEEFVPKMKGEGADVILVLSHSGYGEGVYEEGGENLAYEFTKIKDVDAVIAGHSHSSFPNDKGFQMLENVNENTGTINDIATVQPLNNGRELGVIDLIIKRENDKWNVIEGKSETRSVKGVENDAEIAEYIKPYHEETIKYVNSPVGKITKNINSYFALVSDNESIQLVSDAQKDYVIKLINSNLPELAKYKNLPILSAAAPFKGGLSKEGVNPNDYVDISAGDIRIKDVSNLYKYPNNLAVVKLKGSEVKEWLEMTAGMFNKLDPKLTDPQDLLNTKYVSFNFDTIDGISYEIDVTKDSKYDENGNLINEKSSRIVNLKYKSKELDLNSEFLVVTNNYRAGGGGDFPVLSKENKIVYMSTEETRQIVSDYIKNKSPLTPSKDNNWKLTSVPNMKGKFISNEKGEKYLGNYPSIKVKDNAGTNLKNYIYDFSL